MFSKQSRQNFVNLKKKFFLEDIYLSSTLYLFMKFPDTQKIFLYFGFFFYPTQIRIFEMLPFKSGYKILLK